MHGIRAAVAVEDPILTLDLVVVGARLPLDGRRRGDAQRQFGEDPGLEDPLRPEQRDALTHEGEAPGEGAARELLSVNRVQLVEVGEGGETDAGVEVCRAQLLPLSCLETDRT